MARYIRSRIASPPLLSPSLFLIQAKVAVFGVDPPRGQSCVPFFKNFVLGPGAGSNAPFAVAGAPIAVVALV